ncbi:MAG TPA: GNAT family N-acetyltransferase [Bacteroidales bacterium]|nr:GNAT family N-acetyltransferase [Bacteroidales bacterium]
MEVIIPPIKTEILLSELTKDKFVRKTNYGNNEVYIFSNNDSPNLMLEVGRLREIAFRDAGGGTGKAVDIDEYDLSEKGFKQLIVWDPYLKEIVGGYRFIHGKDLEFDENGNLTGATGELFKFSEKFIKEYLPKSIELGRSFIQPKYQAAAATRKGIFSLDNLWDGLGAVIVDNPDVNYFFGKFTMYKTYNIKARDILLFFLKKYFPNKENLAVPYEPVLPVYNEKEFEQLFNKHSYIEDRKILIAELKKYGEFIPPLVNAYMNLSSTMHTFGTAINYHFGGVEETGILVDIRDIYPSKKHRHIQTYKKNDFEHRAKASI